ncbi:MAG: glutathione S-transferase family protein [Lysobacteraceae bacterium]|nr:MAG: glutathione S-transferase family protein [Xanthomonadaceae bacterium]
MLLIGMYDSPFVRRVAIALDLLGLPFAHRDWSVGKDFDRIRAYSPLGRVPVLAPADGEPLAESMMILEHLDDLVGPERALMPPPGAPRRAALRILAFATGAIEKGIQINSEWIFRPPDKRHPPYVERCRVQMRGALSELEKICAAAGEREWLVGDRMSLVDISLACFVTYIREGVREPFEAFPALAARVDRCEALPVFRRYHAPFEPPKADGGAA